VEAAVTAWLEGGGEAELARVRALGPRAYPVLLARLESIPGTEAPELGPFLARLRTLTSRSFGFAAATTPGARAAARARWVAFLSGE
jgi:hypothetical protein